jgi:hypothetical protein
MASIAFPVAYVIFLLVQAIILKFDTSILIPTTTTPLIYPYFFVNLDTQRTTGVLMWIGILSAAFVAVGFVFAESQNFRREAIFWLFVYTYGRSKLWMI